MKTWKYGLTLVLGLTMLGFSTRLQAQAPAQTSDNIEVPEMPAMPPMPEEENDESQAAEDQPQRGTPMPQAIDDMMRSGAYAMAVEEFEKFIKTATGDNCDMLYMPYAFYDRMREADTARKDLYEGKAKAALDKFLKSCGNTVEAYMLKDDMNDPKVPEKTIELMTQAINVEPGYAILYFRRAEAFWALQRSKEACADYQKAAGLGDGYSASLYEMNCKK